MDKEESLPPDSIDSPDVSGDVESLLPDLPEPEAGPTVPPEASEPAKDAVHATADQLVADEEVSEPATAEEPETDSEPATAATPEATDPDQPKPALPMQKPVPAWAQTVPESGVDNAAAEGNGEGPAPAKPMQKPMPNWAKTVPETTAPAVESEPVDADAKPAVPMARDAPAWAETIPEPAGSAEPVEMEEPAAEAEPPPTTAPPPAETAHPAAVTTPPGSVTAPPPAVTARPVAAEPEMQEEEAHADDPRPSGRCRCGHRPTRSSRTPHPPPPTTACPRP